MQNLTLSGEEVDRLRQIARSVQEFARELNSPDFSQKISDPMYAMDLQTRLKSHFYSTNCAISEAVGK